MQHLESFGNGIEAHESVVTAIGCFALYPKSFEQAVSTGLMAWGRYGYHCGNDGALVGAHIVLALRLIATAQTRKWYPRLSWEVKVICEKVYSRFLNPNKESAHSFLT